MAKRIKTQVSAEVSCHLVLNESEIRALDAIFGYRPEVFIKAFKEKMGAAYVEPHLDGVRSLHATIRNEMAGPIAQINRARMILQHADVLKNS